jgi:nucleoside diphosphate kinase
MSKFNYIVQICKNELGVLPAERDGKLVNAENGQEISIDDLEAKVKELEAQAIIDAKIKAIETYIYKYYPAKKQAQDEKWVSSYTTKLKAGGVVDLEVKAIAMITSFFSGKSLSEVLVDVSEDEKPFFEKLVKVGVRTEWAELCVIEGKTAIAENREPVYAEFPKFD